MNNPFEGKAIKFETEQELNHLAELARGYGLKVGSVSNCNLWKYNLFRKDMSHDIYGKYSTNGKLPGIPYSDFIASLPLDKDNWIIPPNALPIQTSVEQPEMVNHPKHYNVEGFEVIDIITAFGLNFPMGNALKYLLRADRKGKKIEDLKKAIWYLQYEIEQSEKQK